MPVMCVAAGSAWDDPWKEMRVPPAREGSWEDVMHKATDGSDALMIMPKDKPAEMLAWRGNRAIGVVYNPQFESFGTAACDASSRTPSYAHCIGLPPPTLLPPGNYVPTVLPQRYDAFLFIDRTHGVKPIFPPALAEPSKDVEETYPTGV